jgi:hypothetical protein
MKRTFQARLTWHGLLLLLLLGGCLLHLLWFKHIVTAILAAVLLIVVIEQTLNSTYTITDDDLLIVRRGRFRHTVTVRLSDITRVTRARLLRIGGVAMIGYIHIEYAKRYISIFPMHEEVFLEIMKDHGVNVHEEQHKSKTDLPD